MAESLPSRACATDPQRCTWYLSNAIQRLIARIREQTRNAHADAEYNEAGTGDSDGGGGIGAVLNPAATNGRDQKRRNRPEKAAKGEPPVGFTTGT